MKIKDDFIIRQIAGTWIVVPIGHRVVELNGLITLNDTSVFLWQKLEQETSKEDLVKMIVQEYNVEEATAKSDVEDFINQLTERNLLVH